MGGDEDYLDDEDIPEVPLEYLDPGQAEARARLAALAGEAITQYRQQGEERPVVLEIHTNELTARQLAERIKPGLRSATPVPDPNHPDVAVYVMTRAEARAALERGVGKQARRLFRTSVWQTSYYVARITGRGLEWYEGRTWWDAAADQGRPR
jgi:hypothetical protein